MRPEQRLSERFAQIRDMTVHRQPQLFEGDLAGQRIAVGVQAGRGQPEQHVSRRDLRSGNQPVALDRADDEAGHVVLALGVEAGHFRRLAAEQRAAVVLARAREALDDLLGDIGRKPAGSQVIEEEQRHRALHEDVVHAVVHEIDADRVVPSGQERDLQLGPDTIGARDEHRVAPAVAERKQPAERPDLAEHARSERAARQVLDTPHRLVARVDVHAGGFVVHKQGIRGLGSGVGSGVWGQGSGVRGQVWIRDLDLGSGIRKHRVRNPEPERVPTSDP